MKNEKPQHQFDPSHPDYREGFAEDLSREHRLHQVVAGSAFVLALCLLPVAQFFLLSGSTAAPRDEVAGATTAAPGVNTEETEESRTLVLVGEPTPDVVPTSGPACETRKEDDLRNLQIFAEGKRKALLTEYELQAQPYRVALQNLTGSPEVVEVDRQSLSATIDRFYQPYLTQLQQVETAVSVSRDEIEARVCAVE